MTDGFNAAEYLVDRHVNNGDGDRIAVRYEGRDISYAELADHVAQVAAALRQLGLRTGERIVCSMADSPEMLATILGAFRAGMVAVPVNTMLTAHDLGAIVVDSEARALVCTSEFATAGAKAIAVAPEVTHMVVVGDSDAVAPSWVTQLSWDELLAGVSAGDAVTTHTTDDSHALWLYSSGTTGKPKGAMHRHANIRHVYETYGRQVLGIRPNDRCLSVAKMFFAYGIGNSVFFPLAVGAMTILEPRRPTPDVFAERVRTDAPTLFFGVPTFYSSMLAAGYPRDLMASVRLGVSAGEPLPAPLVEQWQEYFGMDILDGLGSTEALHIFVSNLPDDIGPGTSGYAVPGYELEIRRDDGTLCERGKPGSLFVKGESIALGYWNRVATTRHVFQGEWLATGDTYVRDEQGRYQCLGRSDDMIKSGGIWVSPGEVESRLLEHDDVIEAAVVGVPDEQGLDKPVAYVVLASGSHTSEDDLRGFCRDGLAHFKAPKRAVILEELPRTATGKLQRFRLREMAP